MIADLWNIRIKDISYRNIRPLSMHIFEKAKKSGHLKSADATWVIKFRYDSGSLTMSRTDLITFKTEQEARWWYNHIWENVFAKQSPQPKGKILKFPGKKKNHLTLV